MFPIITLEMIEEGLFFFRSMLTLYRQASTTVSNVQAMLSYLRDDLKHHKAVPGEEIYLYLLGTLTLKRIANYNRNFTIDDRVISQIVMKSILQLLKARVSSDAQSIVNYFAYTLGQELQQVDPNTVSIINDLLLDANSRFVTQDVVLVYLKTGEKDENNEFNKFLDAVNVLPDEWASITANVSMPGLINSWVTSINAAKGKSFHKLNTFLGLILRGAKSLTSSSSTYVDITSGPASITLDLGILHRPSPIIMGVTGRRDIGSLTSEMISNQSKRTMANRGYIYLDKEKEWAPPDEITWTTDERGIETAVRKAVVKDITASAKQMLSAQEQKYLSTYQAIKRLLSLDL